jgi:hypothetical protein
MHAKLTRDRKKLFTSRMQQAIQALERHNQMIRNRLNALIHSTGDHNQHLPPMPAANASTLTSMITNPALMQSSGFRDIPIFPGLLPLQNVVTMHPSTGRPVSGTVTTWVPANSVQWTPPPTTPSGTTVAATATTTSVSPPAHLRPSSFKEIK